MNALDILIDAAGRPLEAAQAISDRLDAAVLDAHPGGHPNSAAWLLWHAARQMDAQVAALSGREAVWTAQGFAHRFALGLSGDELGAGGMGYAQREEDARRVVVEDGDLLLEHLAAVTEELVAYLGSLSEADLDDVVDESWDPPVTRGVRLVSVIDDAAQHVGQAAYIAGMPVLS